MYYMKEQYPVAFNLYNEFINSEEYNQHPVTKQADKRNGELFKEAVELIKSGDILKAEGKFMSSCCDYENAGFYFGFMLALRLLKETGTVTA